VGLCGDTSTRIRGLAVFAECLEQPDRLACGNQHRLTGSGSALEALGSALEALRDDALYKSTHFTSLYNNESIMQ